MGSDERTVIFNDAPDNLADHVYPLDGVLYPYVYGVNRSDCKVVSLQALPALIQKRKAGTCLPSVLEYVCAPYQKGLSSLAAFTFLEAKGKNKSEAEQSCCDVERLGLELCKCQRTYDSGSGPCGEHEAINLADISRAEIISCKCGHGGKASAVAGKQVACRNEEYPVVAEDAHGNEDVDDGLRGEHEPEDALVCQWP